MKSRGAGLAVALSVLPAARLAAVPDCEAGWGRPAVELAPAPGEGADACNVAGRFAHPLATRISNAAGTTKTLLMG
jgi:hypothetical protein